MGNHPKQGYGIRLAILVFTIAAILTVLFWPSGVHAQTTAQTVVETKLEKIQREATEKAAERAAKAEKKQAEREEKLAEARFRAELEQIRNGSRAPNVVRERPRTVVADNSRTVVFSEDGREKTRIATTENSSKTREAAKLELDLAKERRKEVEARYRDQCAGWLGAWRCSPSVHNAGFYSGGAYFTGGSTSGSNYVVVAR